METRIIKAVFGASKSIVAPKRFKNDWGQVLELVGIELPQVFEVHFSNSRTGTAKKRVGQDNRVDVPAEYFESGADIFCWVMVHDAETDGRTMYTIRIPIEDRADATDVEPTPVEQDVITQAIAALNAAVTQTAQDVESADASAQSASDSADRAETARDTAEGYVDDVQGYAQQAQASASNASASATASANSASQAQQIKTDVQGLVSDAQSAASASAQSATVSAQSASHASASATSASQSAETASTKASEASASAQTASAKATEASGYASTASTKATEASQSASSASGYATQAGQAKTAAETAQGLAEQAQSDAESAKDDAESARDEAQQIVNGISGKVEQIDQNTADIADLEADRYKAYATDTATGAVASFHDGADNIPMSDVKVQIEPVQDLHGYDNPWPAGGGKNLLDINNIVVGNTNNWSVEVNGDTLTVTHKTEYTSGTPTFVFNQPSGTYVVSIGSVNITGQVSLYVNGAWAKTINNGNTFTIDAADTNEIKFSAQKNQATIISKIQIESGSTATAFTPYENICPISGWTQIDVNHSDADMTNPTTLTIQLGQTVYGGKVDVLSGELVIDRAYTLLNNPDKWIKSTSDTADFRYDVEINDRKLYDNSFSGLTCSYVPCAFGAEPYGRWNASVGYYFSIKSSTITLAQVKADASAGNIAIAYAIAQPITIQLTPNQVNSLLGVNNIWADSGDTEVVYRADTQRYIDKKIAEVIASLT